MRVSSSQETGSTQQAGRHATHTCTQASQQAACRRHAGKPASSDTQHAPGFECLFRLVVDEAHWVVGFGARVVHQADPHLILVLLHPASETTRLDLAWV
eukprot:1524458-Rhodomonas_salina.3